MRAILAAGVLAGGVTALAAVPAPTPEATPVPAKDGSNVHVCGNTCEACGHSWTFDVMDSSDEFNYCYRPNGDPSIQSYHRCFGDDAKEVLGCASLPVNEAPGFPIVGYSTGRRLLAAPTEAPRCPPCSRPTGKQIEVLRFS
jgi:hypothetical protein